MKKSINKRVKIALMLMLLIIITIMAALIYLTIKNPGVREEKITLLNYNNKTEIKYKVILKPNPLYSGDSLEEDKLYLTSYVDNIKTNLQYEFRANKVVDILGDYEILAIVEGYTIEEKKVKVIWQKEFTLLPKTNFKSKDANFSINKEIVFPLEEYINFAAQIREATELNVPINASVVMNVSLQVEAGSNFIEKKVAPSINIPLDSKFFEITKSGIENTPGAIEETKQIPLPVNQNLVIAYSTVLGLALLALLYLLVFVKGDKPVDIFKKQLNKIFKSHGTRLVAINNEIGTTFGMYYKVKSIEDLVRMADELGKPIMYRYSTDPKEITKFYIHDDKSMFSFNLKDMLAEMDMEASEADNLILENSKEVPME
ncbi:MAG: hypothetical protein K0Q99_916 [Clostridia bacterium]|jgi:hypothetical protein|nr:hypothetical protein [Clostridia bacterium]